MKHCLIIPGVLLLSACVGLTRQEFLQDQQNITKSAEFTNKRNRSADCDKLEVLNSFLNKYELTADEKYGFVPKRKATADDLKTIMPVFGLKPQDSTNLDKVLSINYSIIDKLNCQDNARQLIDEQTQYCDNKYSDNTLNKKHCKQYLQDIMFNANGYYAETDKQLLKQNIKQRIHEVYPMPNEGEWLSEEFTELELVKANNTKLGKYDGDCSYNGPYAYMNIFTNDLCDYETNTVTRLNAARTLYNFCINKTFLPDETDKSNCICYAHETYNKVSFQNLIYIYEKEEIPQSKKNEFEQLFAKCKRKIEQKRIKKEQDRYGEASKQDDTVDKFIGEVLDNAAWTHKTITEIRKEQERKDQ